MQSESPVLRDIVLIGGGHSHVVVLRRFAMAPVPGVRLTLICRDTHTPYSGMLPGYIAGHYTYDDVHIDLRRLAEFAGARYLNDEVIGLDRANRQILCRHRPPVSYDWASINIGSTPHMGDVPGAREHAVPVKPIFNFNQRWLSLLERVKTHDGPLHIAVVGAGAGGVEMTLAMQHRLRAEMRRLGRPEHTVHFTLVTRAPVILPTHNARVRGWFEATLRQREVTLVTGDGVARVAGRTLVTESGRTVEADETLWVTQAGGADWLKQTGLELDDLGFVKVTDTLQSVSDPTVFAAGDVASMIHHPREKAGVFAVRMGR
ncbi:MAG: bifunctional NADH dehydrogenase FAD-containing subunit/selenide, water dikinase SelD, partial [Gammaproteobacteria bacterium]